VNPELIVVIVVIVLILFAVLGAAAREQDRRYRRGLRGWAAACGWAYCGNGGEWTPLLYRGELAALLPRGDRGRGVELQLDGTRQGRPVTVAHYWYKTTSTNRDSDGRSSESTSTHALAVIVVRLAARYPAAELQRRGLGLGWGLAASRAAGRQPANLTGNEEFDRRYRIRTEAPGGSALVTPQVISAYLASDLPLWQLSDDQLVITRPGAIRVDHLDQEIDQALTIAGLLDSPATRP
jgi:hypothetical protein